MTITHQVPMPMEFSRQEYWSGLSFPSPGDLPNPGIKPRSLALQADSLPDEPPGKPPVALLWQPLKKKIQAPNERNFGVSSTESTQALG